MCFPVITSLCFDIMEGTNKSFVKHRIAISSPSGRGMETPSDICNLKHGRCQTLKATTRVINELKTIMKTWKTLEKKDKTKKGRKTEKSLKQACGIICAVSPSSWKSFLEMRRYTAGKGMTDVYFVFKLEMPHNLHLGILEILKECMLAYFLS